jgi:hypothetical protein
MNQLQAGIAFALAALLSACGGGGSADPPATIGALASAQIVQGDSQAAVVGQELPLSLKVRLVGSSGAPIPGQVVTFRVTSGAGTVFAGSVSSDANGIATDRWTLGTSAGAQSLEVRGVNASGAAVALAAFTATATAGQPASIAVINGNNQTAEQLRPLPMPLIVRVVDAYGNPTPGVAVSFTSPNGGAASPSSTSTNTNGEATTNWVLGLPIATQSLSAAVSATLTTTFLAVATQAPPSAAVTMVKVSGDAQTLAQHTAVPQPLQMRVIDVLGNGVPGVQVNFAAPPGSGYVQPRSVATDISGSASWSGYIHAVGAQGIVASTPGLAPVMFTAVATASGRPFDGEYLIFNAQGSPPFGIEYPSFFMRGSVVPETTIIGPYFVSFSEVTGQLEMQYRADLVNRYYLSGTLMADAFGRVTGSGTMMRGSPGNLTPAGSWTAERR